MSSFTAEEVEKAINQYEADHAQVKDYRDELEDYYFDWFGDEESKVELKGLGTLEFVETTPDDPGDGKYYGSVWKLGDQYFCKDGYYSSWDSSEFDGEFHEVKQVEKTVRVWE